MWRRAPDLAVLVGGVVEEAARAAVNAAHLGGPAPKLPHVVVRAWVHPAETLPGP